MTEDNRSAAEKIEAETGIDIDLLEIQTLFRLDMGRMHRGEPAELGYVFIDRQHNPDAVVVFTTPEQAREAENSHPLIDSLVEEDCLDCFTLDKITLADVAGHEVILP